MDGVGVGVDTSMAMMMWEGVLVEVVIPGVSAGLHQLVCCCESRNCGGGVPVGYDDAQEVARSLIF